MRIILPKFRIDDIFQTKNFSPAQEYYFEHKTPMEYTMQALSLFEDRPVVLAIVAEGIDTNPELVEYIKKHPQWEVQAHCWEHKVMKGMNATDLWTEIKAAKEKIEDTFDQAVTEFYPPKHYISDDMFRVCAKLRLSLSVHRTIPAEWMDNTRIPEVYFHFWNPNQIKQVQDIIDLCHQQQG